MSDTNTTNGVLTLSEDSVLNTVILSENQAPTPQQDSASVFEFGTIENIDVLSNDSDPEGDALTVIEAIAEYGSAYVNPDNSITYSAGFAGIDTITYTVQDIFGNTAQSFVVVDVLGDTGGGGFNSSPVASDDYYDYYSVYAGMSTSISVLENDYDPDGDYLTVIAAYSAFGNLVTINNDNTLTYDNDYYQLGDYQDVVNYTIQDAFGNTSQASAYVNIAFYPNVSPIANDDYVTTDEFSSVTVDVVANDYDPEGGSLILDGVYLQQGEGDILVDGNNITVTPTAGIGAQEIVVGYTVTDGMDTSSATLNVSVSPSGGGNNTPVANEDYAVTLVNQSVTVNVLANDYDIDGDSLVLSNIYVSPDVGQVIVNEDNTVTFTPNEGFLGQAEIQYSIQDSSEASASSSLFVNVQSGLFLQGTSNADELQGGEGNDTLSGGDGDDVLMGGAGNDYLSGENGNDTYVFNLGDGQDSLYNFDYNEYYNGINSIDKLVFGAGINPADIELRSNGSSSDLVVGIKGTTDSITLQSYLDGSQAYQLDAIEFADGTVWDKAMIASMPVMVTGDNSDNYLSGTVSQDVIQGLSGNDSLYGNDGNDLLDGGIGNDLLNGNSGNDTLYGGDAGEQTVYSGSEYIIVGYQDVLVGYDDAGNAQYENQPIYDYQAIYTTEFSQGNDTLLGGDGDDVLMGGAGNDYVSGDNGNDTYVFNLGDGQDSLYNFDNNEYYNGINSIDKLVFGAGINPADIELRSNGSGSDLVVGIKGTNDSITIQYYFDGSQAYQLDAIEFADGTVWTATHIAEMSLNVIGDDNNNALYGVAGNDTIQGLGGDDQLYGNNGNDSLDGGVGHDSLYGGTGNDMLYGGEAGQAMGVVGYEDVIVGYQEVIVGYQEVIVGYQEVLVGYTDVFIGYQEVYVRDDLVIIGYEDVIVDYDIEGQPIYETRPIETWQAVYETQAIYQQEEVYESQPIYNQEPIYENQPIYGQEPIYGLVLVEGNDVLVGEEGDDVLVGGVGNDYLGGGGGRDTYVYRVGDGYDIINNYDYSGMIDSPNGELVFENLNHTDVSFMRDMLTTDLVMTINSTGETVRVQAYFQEGDVGIATSSYALASIHFLADGVILGVDDVINRLVVNQAPVADNDVASTRVHITHYEDGSPDNIFADGVTVNVLVNDHDPDSDALSVNILSVTGGTAYLNFDQTISYFADGSQNQAEIHYQISDGRGGYAEAVVTVDVAITESLVYTPIVPDEAPFDYNPTENDYGYAQGDPHMYTFDGVAYEFQAVGEFTFVQGDGYEVQIRTEAINNRVSGVTATAMKFGDDVVGIYSKAANRLVINGAAVELASGVSIKVGSGYVSRQGDTYEINDGAGHLVLVDSTAGYDFVRMPVPKNQSVTGLLGNANDSHDDEFMLRDGTQLDSNIPESTIYTTFANSWRVDNSTSLFVYGAGESTATYTNLNFPVDGVGNGDWRQDFDPNIVAWAEQIALDNRLARGTVVFENAVLDIVVSGNDRIIQQTLQIAQELAEAGVELIVNQQMPPMQTGTLATLANGLEDTTYILSVNDLLQGFTDVNGDVLSVVNLTATNGVLSDNQDGTYTFTPNANFYGAVNLNYQVSDGRGGMTSAENSFLLDAINDAPTVNPNVVFDTQQVNENQAFSFSVAQDAFIDVDGDNLSYSAIQANGDALPSWLSFDSATRTFMGTPSFNDAANLMLKVIASDGLFSTEQVFSLMVNNVNRLPTGSPTVVLASVNKGTQSYNIALSDLLQGFSDLDGDTLMVANLTADHATVVNNNNGTYTLTLEANYAGVVELNYQVSDGQGGSINTTQGFTVVVNTTGTTGADVLEGGDSDDTYIVNNVRDVVVEADASGGTDTVQSSLSHNLGNNVENLILVGSANLSGTGNNLDNSLEGNNGNNRLLAGLGNDTINGGAGGDTLNGGEGADVMYGGTGNDTFTIENANDLVVEIADQGYDTVNSFITYTLTANVERLNLENAGGQIDGFGNDAANTLNGNNFANYLFGGAGNDTLQGKGGADTLEGGLDDDVYYVDNIGDVVTELAGEGTDKVNSTVSYTLTANVEQLYLTGIAGLSGTGNAQNNIIYGNSGNNLLSGGAGNDSLNGGAGNDTLDGGQGNDTLVGGLGNDTYLLGIGSGRDVIDNKDSVGNDVLLLGAGITAEQVWLRQLGNDLEVSIIGTNNSAKVKGWYSGDVASKIDSVQLADGRSLLANEVQTLVDAMATFAPPTTGQTTLSTEQQNALGAVITASW